MRRQFEYTTLREREGISFRKPCIGVVLSRDDGRPNARHSFEVTALIDTGSDLCLFDWAIATYMNIDPKIIGQLTEVGGFSGTQNIYLISDIKIAVPSLNRSFSITAGFGMFSGGIGGVLGHRGFLDHVSVTFTMGEHFEFVDDDPAPVVPLHPA